MKKTLVILSILLMLSGCRTHEVVSVRHHFSHSTDSVYIECTDSVFVLLAGDTVRIREVERRVEYRLKYISDTIVSTDTVRVAAMNGEKKTLAKTRKNYYIFGLICGIIIIFALSLLTKKIKP